MIPLSNKVILVKLDEINFESQPFIVSSPHDTNKNSDSLKHLGESIKKYGLLSPVIIQKKGNSIFLVHGLNRVLACRFLGMADIACQEISAHVDQQGVYLFSLCIFLSHHKPNIIEKSKIINRLSSFFSEERVIQEYFPLLGLPPNKKVFFRVSQLSCLEKEIAYDLAKGSINEELALKLLKFSSSERLALYRFLQSLPFTVSQQFELVEYINDIARRDEVDFHDLLNHPFLVNILTRDIDEKKKAHMVKGFLRKKRYPKLTALEDDFLKKKKKLSFPEKVTLHPPDNFEHGNFRFEIKFFDSLDFEKKIQFLNKLLTSDKFHSLISHQ